MAQVQSATPAAAPAPVTGVIYPPTAIREVVDRTAQFVAKHGRDFEQKILSNNDPANQARFSFLRLSDPYHLYYELKIQEILEGLIEPSAPEQNGAQPPQQSSAPAPAAPSPPPPPTQTDASAAKPEVTESAKTEITKEVTVKKAAVTAITARAARSMPKEAPPPQEFKLRHPQIASVDSDIIKLAAQYTAAKGPAFLSGLTAREQRNPQFDFLRPTHALFSYFSALVESYTKVLSLPPALKKTLLKTNEDRLTVLDRCLHRLEWARMEEEKRKAAQAEEDADKVAYLSVDWHDFVLVETIDFVDIDQAPAPMADGDEDMDMEMDEEEMEEDEDDVPVKPTVANDDDEEIKIVTNYTPQVMKSTASSQQFMTDPSGRQIPLDQVGEHMRIEMLDPKWREEQQRRVDKQKETAFAAGEAIAQNLERMAKRRADIFATGQEAKNDEGKQDANTSASKVTWDGYTSSINATRAAAALQKPSSELDSSSGPSIGPSSSRGPPPVSNSFAPPPRSNPASSGPPSFSSTSSLGLPPHLAAPQPIGSVNNPFLQRPLGGGSSIPGMGLGGMPGQPPMGMGMGMGMGPPGSVLGLQPGMPNQPPPMPNFGLGHHGQGMMHPQMQMPGGLPPQPLPPPMMPSDTVHPDEPPTKRAKADTLLSEDEFAARFPNGVTVRVYVPLDSSNPQWGLNGQMLEVPMEVKASVKAFKDKLADMLGGMPASKQQLKAAELGFLKDNLSLAHYNLGPGSIVELSVRSRGGRR